LVLYFSELPIISYVFSKIKTIYKSFLKLLLKKKRIFIKNAADVSMMLATFGLWADIGPKVLLGRKWPNGCGPVGLVGSIQLAQWR
jgi:hypothetical protein